MCTDSQGQCLSPPPTPSSGPPISTGRPAHRWSCQRPRHAAMPPRQRARAAASAHPPAERRGQVRDPPASRATCSRSASAAERAALPPSAARVHVAAIGGQSAPPPSVVRVHLRHRRRVLALLVGGQRALTSLARSAPPLRAGGRCSDGRRRRRWPCGCGGRRGTAQGHGGRPCGAGDSGLPAAARWCGCHRAD